MESYIKEYAYYLRLGYITNNFDYLCKQAKVNELSYEEFLQNVLKSEVDYRKSNLIRKRTRQAKFPYIFTLEDFKLDHLTTEIKRKIKELSTLEFIYFCLFTQIIKIVCNVTKS